MINVIFSVTALDRNDNGMRLFIDREICIEYLIKNWGNDVDFWECCIEDFEDWCIDHNYNLNESLKINEPIFKDYMRYMLNKNIHYFDDYDLFEISCFHKQGFGTFCKLL